MKISKSEQEYWDALQRLKSGKTQHIDTKSVRFKFTKDAVGREAGKGKGFVRYERYPSLCDEISNAESARKLNGPITPSHAARLQHEKNLKIKVKSKYEELKQNYDSLMAEHLNVVRRNFELETGLVESQNIKLVQMSDKQQSSIINLL